MKKLCALALAAVLAVTLAGCGDAASTPAATPAPASEPAAPATPPATAEDTGGPENGGSSILVAYFSLAGEQYEVGVIEKGNTQLLAEEIAAQTGADLFAIQPVDPYPDTYEELLEVSQNEDPGNPPAIAATVENFDEYDTVFVGYPIWWGDMPAIVQGFLQSYDWTGKTVIPFCTHAGSGLGRTQQRAEELCPGATVLEGLDVRGQTAQQDAAATAQAVTQWLDSHTLPE